jgi:hypothetical protein
MPGSTNSRCKAKPANNAAPGTSRRRSHRNLPLVGIFLQNALIPYWRVLAFSDERLPTEGIQNSGLIAPEILRRLSKLTVFGQVGAIRHPRLCFLRSILAHNAERQ